MPISELTGVITVSVFVVNTFFLFYWELLEHFILYFLSLWMTLHVLWEWHEWRCSSYCSEHRLPLLLLLSLVPLLFACLCFPSFSCIVFYSYYLFSVVRFLLLLIFSFFLLYYDLLPHLFTCFDSSSFFSYCSPPFFLLLFFINFFFQSDSFFLHVCFLRFSFFPPFSFS